METSNNKPTISDLCSAASLYYQTFQHISGVPYTIPQHITDEVNKLHHVMDGMNKEDVHNWLFKEDDKKGLVCRYDFINEDPIDLVKRTKNVLEDLWEEIRDKGEIIEQIDTRCDEVWEFCETWAEWLKPLIPTLENLRQVAYDTTPTDKEKRWLRLLLKWNISRWLMVFIYSNASLSLFGKRRLLRLALATDGIDEDKQARLHEALAQIDEQIKEAARGEQAAEHNACISTEPRTDRAKQAFAKAVELDFMIQTSNGYKWTFDNGSKVSLGYFICMVYNQDNTKITPFKALEKLFGVSRLDRAAEQATSAKKPQPWRDGIDKLLQSLENNT